MHLENIENDLEVKVNKVQIQNINRLTVRCMKIKSRNKMKSLLEVLQQKNKSTMRRFNVTFVHTSTAVTAKYE